MANKLNWLEEVKKDAEYITLKRIREQEEKRAYEESKTQIAEAKPIEQKKGK